MPVEVDPNYRRLVTKLFAKPAGRMGLRSKPSDTDDDRLQRPVITSLVAAEGRGPVAPSLRREAHELTVAWLRDGSAIDPDMVSSVLAIGGRDLDAALWARIHEAAKVEVDRKRRKQLLEALGHVEAPALVKRNFEVVLADDFDPRESMTLVWGAMDTRSTRLLAYAFITENFDRLVARLPEDWSLSLAEITGSFYGLPRCAPRPRPSSPNGSRQRLVALAGWRKPSRARPCVRPTSPGDRPASSASCASTDVGGDGGWAVRRRACYRPLSAGKSLLASAHAGSHCSVLRCSVVSEAQSGGALPPGPVSMQSS